MFVRIPLWRRLVLDFCLLGLFTSHFQFQSLWLVCSYFVFLSGWDVDDCTFLRTCPFFLGCSFCWHIIVCSSLLWSFISLFSVVTSPFSYMILLISALSLFYVMWLAKGLSILFSISKSRLLVSLIFSIVFFCSQAPLAFKAKRSGDSLSCCQNPQLWSLRGDTELSLVRESLCDILFSSLWVTHSGYWM